MRGPKLNTMHYAKRIAKQTGLPATTVYDTLAFFAENILRELRRGNQVAIPGHGVIRPHPWLSRDRKSRKKKPRSIDPHKKWIDGTDSNSTGSIGVGKDHQPEKHGPEQDGHTDCQ